MKYLSTKEVARKVGIGRGTLERWLTGGKLSHPRAAQIGQGSFRQWTDSDVERVREYKRRNYRKGRGRKKGDPARAEHRK
jgi:excisionase family DNA binding protein